jgi:hypothetical protein
MLWASFHQNRHPLRPEALFDLLGYSAQTFAGQDGILLWHGRRLLALDVVFRAPSKTRLVFRPMSQRLGSTHLSFSG